MLSGLRVLDFSQYLPGPYASLRLAEMGAEVTKIERPPGDPARFLSEGVVFRANNRNKKSLLLQLNDKNDHERVRQLIEKTDVIIESFRPGVMKKFGLDYDAVKVLNPSIIYCSLTGYGNDSPLAQLGSHDLNYMALSGVLSQLSDSNGKPVHPTMTISDLVGGIAASEAILAAYIHQLKTGEGAYIDVALLDMVIGLQTTHLLYEQEGLSKKGIPEINGSNISYHLYETKDGRFVSIAALEPKFWQAFCEWANKQEWLDAHLSPANEDNPVYKEIQECFKSYLLKEWLEIAMKVDACLAPVLSIEELQHHPHMKKRGIIFDAEWGDRQVRTTAFKNNRFSSPPGVV